MRSLFVDPPTGINKYQPSRCRYPPFLLVTWFRADSFNIRFLMLTCMLDSRASFLSPTCPQENDDVAESALFCQQPSSFLNSRGAGVRSHAVHDSSYVHLFANSWRAHLGLKQAYQDEGPLLGDRQSPILELFQDLKIRLLASLFNMGSCDRQRAVLTSRVGLLRHFGEAARLTSIPPPC